MSIVETTILYLLAVTSQLAVAVKNLNFLVSLHLLVLVQVVPHQAHHLLPLHQVAALVVSLLHQVVPPHPLQVLLLVVVHRALHLHQAHLVPLALIAQVVLFFVQVDL